MGTASQRHKMPKNSQEALQKGIFKKGQVPQGNHGGLQAGKRTLVLAFCELTELSVRGVEGQPEEDGGVLEELK